MSSKILKNTLIGLSSAERLDFSVFSAENRSLWDSLPEDATRVIKLDELQFGRNYKKEK